MRHSPPAPAIRLALLAALAVGAQAQPLISELCDPHANYQTDRFVEIYNPAAAPLDLAGWQLVAMANGAPAFSWPLSGLIEPGQALVAGDATTAVPFPVVFADEAWSGANGSWNGKVGDGAVLRDPQGVAVDSVVVPDNAFENKVMTRLAAVDEPSGVYLPTEWESHAVELASDATPGFHNAQQQPDGPAILALGCRPEDPAAGDSVWVWAVVHDDGAQIEAVWLSWGTAPDALSHTIDLQPSAADTFASVAPIPAQEAGTTVYWRISARNTLPATTESVLRQFALAHEVTIAGIQGTGAASPYDGQPVRTRGVVTARFGADWVLQDQHHGLWVKGGGEASPGDSLWVAGTVSESASPPEEGMTALRQARILAVDGVGAQSLVQGLSTGEVADERWESVLVQVDEALCAAVGADGARLDDGSGVCLIGGLAGEWGFVSGSRYRVQGVVQRRMDGVRVQPRGSGDVVWLGDETPPSLVDVMPQGPTLLRVSFSEALDSLSASLADHYQVDGHPALSATVGPAPHQVRLQVEPLASGGHLLSVTGVADIHGNTLLSEELGFDVLETGEPAGYYDAAEGLSGTALNEALHEIIDDHNAHSYEFAWTAYQTTDVRPDTVMVWDIYSDTPGATPPYLYAFGLNEGGVGGSEGTGYTREHTWCKNWFGGEVMPMYADLFTLFPCDTHMNGTRGVHPYGETNSPSWTSLNGSRVGPSSVPGYTDTVFEPIDEFKGDLARAYLYFSTRYLGEDTDWPGGPATDGAALRPWAQELYQAWHEADPVSQKEIDRNNAIYQIQGNRNPFVDRPGLVEAIQGTTGLGAGQGRQPDGFELTAHPNPFNPTTTLGFMLTTPSPVTLRLFNLAGQEVARLLDNQPMTAGTHRLVWSGTDAAGRQVASGLYLGRIESGSDSQTLRLMLLR